MGGSPDCRGNCLLPRQELMHFLAASRRTQSFVAIVLWAAIASAGHTADESLLRGLVAGCVDAQQRLNQQPLSDNADLMSDAESRKKLLMQDREMMAAIARINDACIEGLKSGRRFYPSGK